MFLCKREYYAFLGKTVHFGFHGFFRVGFIWLAMSSRRHQQVIRNQLFGLGMGSLFWWLFRSELGNGRISVYRVQKAFLPLWRGGSQASIANPLTMFQGVFKKLSAWEAQKNPTGLSVTCMRKATYLEILFQPAHVDNSSGMRF